MIDTLHIDIQKISESRISEVDFDNIIFGRHYTDHMFIADYHDGNWTDLRIIPYGNLSLSPATTTLHYGQSIFEGMKAYRDGKGEINLFRPQDNFERLNISAKRMCIPNLPEDIFFTGLKELISMDSDWVPHTKGYSLYVRPFIFAMDDYIGIRPSSNYRFMIILSPVGAYYAEPVSVKIETHYTRAASGGTGYAKAAGNYAGSLYPSMLAREKGYHQLIWTDASNHEYIEEAGTMNVLFQIDGKLLTPAPSDSILDGITRRSVVALAKHWGMPVEERKISIKEVIEAAENGKLEDAFGAGTAATIAHIDKIGYNGKDYELPAIENRSFSNKVRKALDEIKYGETEDTFGWLMKI